jgi:uncharacterized protein
MKNLVKIKDHKFILSPLKTIFWENKNTLLISDLHLGKAEHFINNFIPVPYNVDFDLQRFEASINEFNTQRVIILGDLFHAHSRVDKLIFAKFLNRINKNVVLVLGNHDILSKEIYKEVGITKTVEHLNEDMFTFTHKPTDSLNKGKYNFHGHLHPGIKLKGRGALYTKIACFVFGENSACLPAFGGLTGKHIINVNDSMQVYAVAEDFVRKVT